MGMFGMFIVISILLASACGIYVSSKEKTVLKLNYALFFSLINRKLFWIKFLLIYMIAILNLWLIYIVGCELVKSSNEVLIHILSFVGLNLTFGVLSNTLYICYIFRIQRKIK